jgi:hypothetical protein
MLSRPLPGLLRRLCGAAATAALALSGGYAIWATRPAPAYAQASHAEWGEHIAAQADRITRDNNGDSVLSGNVVITLMPNEALWIEASNLNPADGAKTREVRDVRVLVGKFVVTAERGTLEDDGTSSTLRTDSARIAPVAAKN